jgi:hypothetical protein
VQKGYKGMARGDDDEYKKASILIFLSFLIFISDFEVYLAQMSKVRKVE